VKAAGLSSFPPKQLFLIQTSLLQLGPACSYKTVVLTHPKGEEGTLALALLQLKEIL